MKHLSLLLFIFSIKSIYSLPPINREQLNEKVDRPNHLEGVPLERDGQLNKDFRKEILLGNAKPKNEKEAKEAIRELFFRADLNKDNFLSEEELEREIHKNALMHINESRQEARKLFEETDLNKDKEITWEEYSQRFEIDPEIKSETEHSFEAQDEDKTKSLNLTEFMGFLHPELSRSTVQELAEELLRGYDKDGNGMISRDEFVDDNGEEIEGPYAEQEKREHEARGNEFDRDLDSNGDGFAILEELISYVDPQGEGRHKREVSELVWQVDTDEDGKLSLDEMLAQNLLLERSSLFAAGRRLHEDL